MGECPLLHLVQTLSKNVLSRLEYGLAVCIIDPIGRAIFALAYHRHHPASDAALAALNCGMNRTSPYSKGKGSSKGKGDNGQSDKGKGAVFVRARTIRWAAHWRRQLEVNNDAELVDNNDEEPEQWMGRRVRFKGGCDMAIAFPQFARDEGLVCAVDDDGDSLVCWDSCPWNPMTVYASQLERVETAEPEGNNDEEPSDEQPED